LISAAAGISRLIGASVWMKILVVLDSEVAASLGALRCHRDRLADAERIAIASA